MKRHSTLQETPLDLRLGRQRLRTLQVRWLRVPSQLLNTASVFEAHPHFPIFYLAMEYSKKQSSKARIKRLTVYAAKIKSSTLITTTCPHSLHTCWRQCPLTSTNICNKPSQTDRVSDSQNLPPAWSNYLPRRNFNALHPSGCLMGLCQPTQSEESMKDSFNRVCSKNMLSTKTREPQLPIHQESNTHGLMFSWFEGRISKRNTKSTALIQRRIAQVPRQHVQVSPKSLQLSAWGT